MRKTADCSHTTTAASLDPAKRVMLLLRSERPFHCSRHTAATTRLTLGANLYVVSKLMGHSSIQMTEVYAKIVDQKKVETMNLVNSLFATPTAKTDPQTAKAI